ncbi:MAG: ParB/RepB/Spo0J family partition protein [Lachnospiraceae bacterium]|nr:ParB/RepB/Spo0J family partition protein [Lachnospiraceae bacterium]
MEGLRYFRRKKPGDEGVVATVRAVRTEQIAPDPVLPPDVCRADELQALADSIRRRGIVEPLIVREVDYEDRETPIVRTPSGSEVSLVSDRIRDPMGKKPLYYVVSGEKRLRAARMVGLETVPCLLTECGKEEAAELTAILRMRRPGRHPLDDCALLTAWMRAYAVSRSEAAKKLCVAEHAIGDLLALGIFGTLEKEVLRLAGIGRETAAALSAVRDERTRAGLLVKIAEEGLSDRKAKALIEKALTAEKAGSGCRGVVRDVRLFSNTFDRAVEAMRASGYDVEYEKSDENGSAGFLILIRTENVSRETFSDPKT